MGRLPLGPNINLMHWKVTNKMTYRFGAVIEETEVEDVMNALFATKDGRA